MSTPWLRRRRVPAEYPARGRGGAATRPYEIATSRLRRRRDSASRSSHVVAAAAPRLASTEYPRRSRGATRLHRISTSARRRRDSSVEDPHALRGRYSNATKLIETAGTDPTHDHSHSSHDHAHAAADACDDPTCTDPTHDHSHDRAHSRFPIDSFVYHRRAEISARWSWLCYVLQRTSAAVLTLPCLQKDDARIPTRRPKS